MGGDTAAGRVVQQASALSAWEPVLNGWCSGLKWKWCAGALTVY